METPVRQSNPGRLLGALLTIGLGVAVLAANLGWLAPGAARLVGFAWPAALVLAGLGLLWRALGGVRPRTGCPFALERGTWAHARLLASTGSADLAVRALAEPGLLAAGLLPGGQAPGLAASRADPAEAYVSIRPSAAWLGDPGDWRVELATDVPWSGSLRSGAGHFDLDLGGLAVEHLQLHSTIGDARLCLPKQRACTLAVDLTLGDLTLEVPPGAEVRLVVHPGWLARVSVLDPRLARQGPTAWATVAPVAGLHPADEPGPVCVIDVRLGAGELTVKRA